MSDPILLTPGPLTTAAATKEAMLHDWGSRDEGFIALNARVCERLLHIAGGIGSHVCVPIQGSGTFAVEAMLGTLVPKGGHVLILCNGAYGRRMAAICTVIGRSYSVYDTAEDEIPSVVEVEARLAANPTITHVAVVHCETTSGILNPIEAIAAVVARCGRRLLIDAMSSFGAIPIHAETMVFDALAASANKCLEGVPGVGFVICRRSVLADAGENSPSLSLDLYGQWMAMEKNGQWRFTPPTHVIAALDHALQRHVEEGGVAGRNARYRANCRLLVEGMRAMGFTTMLPDALQAPIIVTFLMPDDPRFVFQAFYDGLRARGYVIYPGKLTGINSFRIGCIGSIGAVEMRGALTAIQESLK